jgi:hypothetical protein
MAFLMGLGLLLPLLAWILNGILIQAARWKKWEDSMPVENENLADKEDPSHPKNLKELVYSHKWEMVLVFIVILILIYAVSFAPPRLTGSIPINPGLPGRPFYSLHWLRSFLRESYDTVLICTSFLCILTWFGILVTAIIRRSPQGLQTGFLVASLSLAGLGQFELNKEAFTYGMGLYLCAGSGFIYWGWLARHRLYQYLSTQTISRSVEIMSILGLLILASFNRLYNLSVIPYGYEGDETKWISEAVNLGIRGLPDSSGEYHRDALPISFYMQAPFQRFFNPGILSARIGVAFYSILGTLVFYWLLRQIAPIPLTILGTYLLSNSIFDFSASRLANVESHVKVWPVLTLAVLAAAVRTRKWQVYGLSGLALAAGMLTYDTAWPILIVVLILATYELIHHKDEIKERVQSLTALLSPTLLVLPLLIPYVVSRLPYYDLYSKGWVDGFRSTLYANLVNVMQSWFIHANLDFLYNRDGPLINAFLLPWLVLGFAVAIVLIRARFPFWMLVWSVFFLFPIPILTSSPLGRLYYPGLPSIYALIAFGMFVFWKELIRFTGSYFKPVILIFTLVPLIWLPLMNLYIYYNEVDDPSDRQIRRELSDMVGNAADLQTLILMPIIPGANEPLQNEYQAVEIALLKKVPPGQISQAYQSISIETLLPSITTDFAKNARLAIILDKTTQIRREQRDAINASLLKCFPKGDLSMGVFFDILQLSIKDRQDYACLPVTLTLTSISPKSLKWVLSNGEASAVTLTCERERFTYRSIEAETIQPGPGWQVESHFAEGWNGQGYLMDNYHSQPTTLNIQNDSPQNTYVWIRYYKRSLENSSGILKLNHQVSSFAQIQDSPLDQWVWERLGPFPFYVGNNELAFNHPYNDDPGNFLALFIDTIILTSEQDFDPNNISRESLPPYFESYSKAQKEGFLPIDLESGTYRCQVEARSALPLVDAYGQYPLFSNPVNLVIQP